MYVLDMACPDEYILPTIGFKKAFRSSESKILPSELKTVYGLTETLAEY